MSSGSGGSVDVTSLRLEISKDEEDAQQIRSAIELQLLMSASLDLFDVTVYNYYPTMQPGRRVRRAGH
jgi:hypothetical protein